MRDKGIKQKKNKKLTPVRFYTNKKRSIQNDHIYIYIIGSPAIPSGCYKLCGELNTPCSGYNYNKEYLKIPKKNICKQYQLRPYRI